MKLSTLLWSVAGVQVFAVLLLSENCVLLSSQCGGSNGRNASGSLKSIATAQVDFRQNDRDGNGVNDFWRADVRGLYVIGGRENPIKLVELPVARADVDPRSSLYPSHSQCEIGNITPKSGFYFKAIRYSNEDGIPVRDSSRFALCAYPAEYGEYMQYTFIINEGNTMYRKDLGRTGGIDVWPNDPIAEGWETLD